MDRLWPQKPDTDTTLPSSKPSRRSTSEADAARTLLGVVRPDMRRAHALRGVGPLASGSASSWALHSTKPATCSVRASSSSTSDKGLASWRELMGQEDVQKRNHTKESKAPARIKSGFFDSLLSTNDPDGRVGNARRIREELQTVELDRDASKRTALVASTILLCADHDEAFNVYTTTRDRAIEKGLRPYDSSLWSGILDNFLKLRPRDTPTAVVPSHMLMEMMGDMHRWGAVSTGLNSMLLNYLGKAASRSDDANLVLHHRRAIVAIHQLMMQQPNDRAGHDIVTVTALINAYNHVGLPQSAREIWSRLIVSKTVIMPATVAVIFDTCGFAGWLREARRTFAWASHESRADDLLDKGAWDAYIECLARCGELREAIATGLGVMGSALKERHERLQRAASVEKEADGQELLLRPSPSAIPGPDRKTLGMLLRFAAARRDTPRIFQRDATIWPELRTRIQQQFPSIWPLVQHEGKERRT